jgi:hypothetical protein
MIRAACFAWVLASLEPRRWSDPRLSRLPRERPAPDRVPVRRSPNEVRTQSAERMVWESTPTRTVPQTDVCGHSWLADFDGSGPRLRHERFRRLTSAGTHGLPTSTIPNLDSNGSEPRLQRFRTSTPTSVTHAIGVRNIECPSDGVRTKFGRSLRNGWCGSRLRHERFRRLTSAGTHGLPTSTVPDLDSDTNGSADSRLRALMACRLRRSRTSTPTVPNLDSDKCDSRHRSPRH